MIATSWSIFLPAMFQVSDKTSWTCKLYNGQEELATLFFLAVWTIRWRTHIYILQSIYISSYISLGHDHQPQHRGHGTFSFGPRDAFPRLREEGVPMRTFRPGHGAGVRGIQVLKKKNKKHMEVSWNRGTPSHHPSFNGIFHDKPTILGYPHRHGTPHI